jgi:peroxiredoxin (alkyl hydroperoxide reductase subunit C)
MTIRVGKAVPDFVAEAYIRGEREPQKIELAAFRGKWVVLFFYPRDFTFICPTEIQTFARLYEQFKQERAVVVGASTDSFYAHKAWFEADPRLQKVNYPVIMDTSHKLSELFEVLTEDGAALRGTFIIDPDGILRHIHINDLDVGRNVEESLRVLRALRTGELCPESWMPDQLTLTALLNGGNS